MNPMEGIGRAIVVLMILAGFAGACSVVAIQHCPYTVRVEREPEER
jgi:hypothetical protein